MICEKFISTDFVRYYTTESKWTWSCSKMFYKIDVLKNFAEFTWKHLRPTTLLKRDSTAGVWAWILRNFEKNLFTGHFLDFFIRFTVSFSTQWTNRNQVFFYFWTCFTRISNLMKLMNFAIWTLYFAKQTKVLSNIY